jgi:hypothetical protein
MYQKNYLLQRWKGSINFGYIFSMKKSKKQSITLPWNIGDFMLKNINKIDEFANHFNNVNLMYVENIKAFD